jgi:PmbA protein
LIDSQGFEGRHRETSFNCFSEITIQDKEGTRYSGYWWEASPSRASLKIENCSAKALSRAAGQIGPQNRRSGRYKMVVDSTVASRLVSPILNALNASAIQQKMSFLEGSSGQKMFSEGLTICDLARTPGKAGSRMYDTEGVATADRTIIDNGTVREYFVSTYMAGKTGFAPTIEDVSRPCLMPFVRGCELAESKKDVSLKDILAICGNGIYVTGFNGGNCNPVTGDFSFGIEGFAFSKGKITHPVKEMLITGNIMTLWNSLVAAGSDARTSSRWQIPTLAFENVSFSA